MTTLFSVLLAAARNLRGLRYGAATGGTTTTLADTALVEPNDYFNNGTIFFLSGNGANKSAVITDWASSTATFTFASLGLPCAAGDRYAVMDGGYYTRHDMVNAINQALMALGPFDYYDETLDPIADAIEDEVGLETQEGYILPDGVRNIKQVYTAINTVAPLYWVRNDFWRENNGRIYFANGLLPDEHHKVRLIYEKHHDAVSADADTITDDVDIERLSWEAAFYAALNRSRYAESSEPNTKEFLALANNMRQEMRRYPVRRCQRTPRRDGLGV